MSTNKIHTAKRLSQRTILAAVAAIVVALLASFFVASNPSDASATGRAQTSDTAPTSLKVNVADTRADVKAPVADIDCPPGTIEHDGQCLEFVPPSDDCPPGTIEHDGQCLEFEVPDCDLGYKLVGLECVPLTIEVAPAEGDGCPPWMIEHEGQCLEFVPPAEGDGCPPGTIEHDGQCLEFEVPECDLGYKLVGLECVQLTFEASPVTEAPPALDVDRAEADINCPPGTIEHDGQCLEFVPPSDECPPGTIEHDGQCLEFEVPECDLGFKLVGLECVPLTIEVAPIQVPARLGR